MKPCQESRAKSREPGGQTGHGAFPLGATTRHSPLDPRPALAAFTLIEIMIVVGIIGMIVAMGVPTLHRMFNPSGLPKMANGVVDLCTQARARAILTGDKTQIVFYPQERRCELVGGLAPGAVRTRGETGTEVEFDDTVSIEMLDIGMRDFRGEEAGAVWFYPNGTSDEMILVLRSDKNEWRKISLEIATGLARVDGNPNNWR